MLKREKIYPAYVSKHNSNRQKQVILSMIPNGEGLKLQPALLKGVISKVIVIFIVELSSCPQHRIT